MIGCEISGKKVRSIKQFAQENKLQTEFQFLQAVQQKKTGEEGGVYYSNIIPPPPNDLHKGATSTTTISELPDASVTTSTTSTTQDGPRRLHITNLPFKIRDNELRTMFEVIAFLDEPENFGFCLGLSNIKYHIFTKCPGGVRKIMKIWKWVNWKNSNYDQN